GEWPLSWAVALLPDLEQQQLFNAANYSGGASSPLNQSTVSATKINALICPSESVATGSWLASSLTNYAANFGGPASLSAWSGPFVPMANSSSGTCACYLNGNTGTVGLQGLTDGTSNTALFSEKLVGPSSATAILRSSNNANRVIFQVPGVTVTDGAGAAQ